jgi:DNA-binding NarL/FixJ family response regulator
MTADTLVLPTTAPSIPVPRERGWFQQIGLDTGYVLVSLVAQLFARRRADDPVRRLTPREREVLGLIAEGHSNAAIARILVVTPGAVEKHTQHIFAKLGPTQDDDQHRRVMATLAYLRG